MSKANSTRWDPAASMLDPRIVDPTGSYVRYAGLPPEELDQVVAVLTAIKAWRESEDRTSLQSRSYMRLNETDMRALRFVIAAKNAGVLVTAGMLAGHLQISTASITKMLDRLEKAGHITRTPHPDDRRAVVIAVTPATHADARATIGRKHARRFDVAAALSPAEREVVIGFLNSLAALEEEAEPIDEEGSAEPTSAQTD
ncbi:MarR family winged helix-turn-helix transcriptional regulator [Microterricola viridarii]|uniref:DNA-binding transcriptional regulator, MarR family n=1 Tax=Microterricola viridarii TaxID=412690 RepID=A0A1H1LPD4_9MICO|nr:MarR family transcriptional regulator [Microterricola viridarii]SDR76433.1 DNA-binding transcriptional regulator, MarR family [Microterricola viridarii]